MSELTPEARALVDMARFADQPTGADRQRVRAALFAKLALPAAASGPTAGAGPGGATGASLVSGKMLVTLAILGALGAGAAWWATRPAQPSAAPERVPALAPAASAAETTAATETTAAAETMSAATAPAAEIETAPAAAADQAPRCAASPPAAPTSTLAEELALVPPAESALRAGDAAGALALLTEHARRFPHGQLAQEREATRIRALCALADEAGARRAAARFLRRWPRSPHAARVRTTCGGAPDEEPR
jgi:hypothetical protein